MTQTLWVPFFENALLWKTEWRPKETITRALTSRLYINSKSERSISLSHEFSHEDKCKKDVFVLFGISRKFCRGVDQCFLFLAEENSVISQISNISTLFFLSPFRT